MNDTQKFSEHINNLHWDHGISDDILKTVVSFFAPTEETVRGLGPKMSLQSGPNMKGATTQKTQSPGRIMASVIVCLLLSTLVILFYLLLQLPHRGFFTNAFHYVSSVLYLTVCIFYWFYIHDQFLCFIPHNFCFNYSSSIIKSM